MGELALRQIQAGIETSRGVIVPATRKLYGTMTMERDQGRRFADESRGMMVKHYRSNPKLIDAGFRFHGDTTFEDLPYFAEMYFQGGVTPVVQGAAAYLWTYAPDLTSDLIRTRTLYAGDDTVQWQAPFCVGDTLDINLELNDAVTMDANGFCRDWIPVTSSFLSTGFTTGFASLSDRVVESVMGYQARLFSDNGGGTMGTTQITGKFISAKAGYHLNNKRKTFGDGLGYSLQKLGRGYRDISCQIVFEGLNQAEFADHYNNQEKLIRVQLLGSAIAGSSYGTTNGAIAAGTPVTSIVTNALTAAVPGGTGINVGGVTFTVAPAGAAAAATSIPVLSLTPQVTIPTGSTVMAAKTINLDFWGYWETFVLGARDTNTTFQLNLVGVYDAAAGYDHRLQVLNGLTQAQGVS